MREALSPQLVGLHWPERQQTTHSFAHHLQQDSHLGVTRNFKSFGMTQ